MRTVTLLLLSLVAACTWAQEIPYKDMMMGRKVFVALRPKYRAELNVSESQMKQIMDAFDGGLSVEDSRVSLEIHGDSDLDTMEKEAWKVLTKEQKQRATELWIQEVGALSLGDAAIAKAVQLTEDQAKKVEALLRDGSRDVMEAMQDGPSEATLKAVRAARSAVGKKVEGLLNEEQKKAFEKLKGKLVIKKEGDSGGLA